MRESILDYIGFTGELYYELSSRMTDREIADRELHISPSTLSKWKKENGIDDYNSNYVEFSFKEWLSRMEKGLSEEEVAKEFGFESFTTYIQYKKRKRIPLKYRG
ncbi:MULTISPECIES: helix-turn-helix domain-containing protein [Bacillus]|uniref:helix-turn-helix domain-containing protein n=1 Tax=Bacillus TaxID=1386 RepID=UPI001CCFC698|nr:MULTISPECIES: helix-turn-helix domain-containing protein [Bacillus]MEC0341907.1 helix-turn-helix domain-containing protein [Bacillus sonorensis]MEC0457407.1 helix-turn-helix domain-containing protein [Bacillus sonorensis]MEC0530798.1 helix-turn-helix domain-containing protein [Bacillus sonorensis]UBF35244.1 helix-turn-helix domain-containing protein [Bacillus sp. PM8313]